MSSRDYEHAPLNNLDMAYAEDRYEAPAQGWDEPYEGYNQEPSGEAPHYQGFYSALPYRSPDRADDQKNLELLAASQKGDRQATAAFIENNLRLVAFLLDQGEEAVRFHALAEHGQAYDDIFQIAAQVMHGVSAHYDQAQGAFSTYAGKAVYRLVIRAFNGGIDTTSDRPQYYGPLIRVPNPRRGFHKVNSYLQRREVRQLGEPSRDELRAETDFTDEEIAEYVAYHHAMVPLSESPEAEAVRDVAREDDLQAAEARVLWQHIRPWLTLREQVVLQLREDKNLLLREVGDLFGVTGERIRRIQTTALKNLRSNPVIAETLDLPLLCDPDFAYRENWHGDRPCPVEALPQPAAIRTRNGILYQRLRPQLNAQQVSWLPEELQEEARRQLPQDE